MIRFLRFFLVLPVIFIALFGCSRQEQLVHSGKIELSSGNVISVDLAVTPEEKERGLSGIQDEDFGRDTGMLFLYKEEGIRKFWMPDTYFNLDVFFLNEDLTVLDLQRDVPYHPGREEPPAIARTRGIKAYHVLELRSDSDFSKEISIGDTLKWASNQSISKIISASDDDLQGL